MILRQTGEGAFLITQPAHAWLCGMMVQAWGNKRFIKPEPREDVALAAALHDIGWLAWDLQPEFDPQTGWPRVFADVPAEVHTRLWQCGVEHAGVYSGYAAILVSMHGDTIYAKTFDPATAKPSAAAAVQLFREEQKAFRRRSLAALRRDPWFRTVTDDEHLALAKRLIAAVDTLSLHLCWGLGAPVEIRDVPVTMTEAATLTLRSKGDNGILVDPWPFANPSLTLQLQGRVLPSRCTSAAQFKATWAEAEPRTEKVLLHPR